MAKRIGHEELSGGEKNNKQFNEFVESGFLTQFFKKPRRGVDAARAEGRLRFGRRPGRAQPRLYQHRPLQRGVAAALQRRGGRPAHHADRDRDRAGELGLLARDRARDAQDRLVLPQGRAARPLGRCAGRSGVSDGRRCHAGEGPRGLRQHLRALPLQQVAAAAGGSRPGRLQRPELHAVLQEVVGLDPDRRLQDPDARHRRRARLPRRQLPVDRRAHSGDVAAHQRLQSARHQCARGQHLERLLLNLLQDAALGRLGHAAGPVRRPQLELRVEGRRSRLHACPVADVAVVDRAVSAQQQRRAILALSLGRGAG